MADIDWIQVDLQANSDAWKDPFLGKVITGPQTHYYGKTAKKEWFREHQDNILKLEEAAAAIVFYNVISDLAKSHYQVITDC